MLRRPIKSLRVDEMGDSLRGRGRPKNTISKTIKNYLDFNGMSFSYGSQ